MTEGDRNLCVCTDPRHKVMLSMRKPSLCDTNICFSIIFHLYARTLHLIVHNLAVTAFCFSHILLPHISFSPPLLSVYFYVRSLCWSAHATYKNGRYWPTPLQQACPISLHNWHNLQEPLPTNPYRYFQSQQGVPVRI